MDSTLAHAYSNEHSQSASSSKQTGQQIILGFVKCFDKPLPFEWGCDS